MPLCVPGLHSSRALAGVDEPGLGTGSQQLHFFAYGLGNSLFLPFRFGAATVLFPAKPTPADIFHVIATQRPTVFFGVPALYSMLVKTFEAAASLDSLRLCVSARAADQLHHLRRSDQVAYAQTRQTVHLREGAQHDQVRIPVHQRHATGGVVPSDNRHYS
jgi:acyl-CoA synthetase (AMP-forming)/AMP-acid ligase II